MQQHRPQGVAKQQDACDEEQAEAREQHRVEQPQRLAEAPLQCPAPGQRRQHQGQRAGPHGYREPAGGELADERQGFGEAGERAWHGRLRSGSPVAGRNAASLGNVVLYEKYIFSIYHMPFIYESSSPQGVSRRRRERQHQRRRQPPVHQPAGSDPGNPRPGSQHRPPAVRPATTRRQPHRRRPAPAAVRPAHLRSGGSGRT
ncbi:hypothetical protein FQZ97_996730 [compost metagenome]